MIYDLINHKVIKYAELVIILFEHCNLKCVMCPQSHDSLENISKEEIMSKVDPIVKWINGNRSKFFKLHIMGGEVFEDYFVSRGYLDIYQEFIEAINDGIIDKEKHVVHNFVTNLVFNHQDEVMEFLTRNRLKVSTSYDSSGRFSKSDFKLFKSNVEYFKDRIEMVAGVMHAPAMRKIIQGDEYFEYLYDNFTVDFDSLWPTGDDKTNRFLMPKESEAFEFYKTLVDKYPKCLNVEHFVTDKPVMKMTCTRGNNFTILQDNTAPSGCAGTPYLKDGKTKDLTTDKIVVNFFEKYNCFQCEYFQKCPFTCFVKADYKYIEEDLDDCVFRKTFDYVGKK